MSNIVWTKHAEERNKDRQITYDWVESTINQPDNFSEIEGGKIKCVKDFGKHTVTVIATKTDNGKYLVLSSWINPPVSGTNDYRQKKHNKNLKKSSPLKKILLTLKNQLGF